MMNNLKIVRGVVTNLQITKGYEDFAFSENDKNSVGAGAVAAAAMGQVFNSSLFAIGSSSTEIDVKYFTCVVEGKRLAGRFHRVGFKEGDEVEFVCDRMQGIHAVVAARDQNKRLVWTLPYHARGETAQNRMALRWIIGFSLVASAVPMMIAPFNSGELLDDILFGFFPKFLICIAVCFFVRSFFIRHGEAATSIFAALGYENPSHVDMARIDRAARKAVSRNDQSGGEIQELWTYRY